MNQSEDWDVIWRWQWFRRAPARSGRGFRSRRWALRSTRIRIGIEWRCAIRSLSQEARETGTVALRAFSLSAANVYWMRSLVADELRLLSHLIRAERSKRGNGDPGLASSFGSRSIQPRSGASSGHRAQGCCGGEIDAGDLDDGLPRGFPAGAIVEVWLALRLNWA